MMDYNKLWLEILKWLTAGGIRILLILILAFVAFKLARLISRRIFAPFKMIELEPEMQKRADTLASLIRYTLNITILVVAVVMILEQFGIDIGPIIAAAGIVGLAVGFGAQHLVQDIISGFFILLEDQIRVGDVVEINGKGGLVERVNLRMTVLRDLAGNVHFIRNGLINVVTNMTKEFSYYVFDIGVAYRENIDEVVTVLKQIDEELRNDAAFKNEILSPLEILGLDRFADSAIIIKARIKTKPIEQWRIGREFNLRLKKKFDELNIEIPFPHITMYMGRDKNGQMPPVSIKLKNTE
jgi:small-conductance mechanosensitive channel